MCKGLFFRNVDLHVHTPASNCFLEKDVTPQDIVDQAIEAGMQAIAITDHNTGEWIDAVKDAAIESELVVFPGVEITVQPGVHVVAIFPETCNGADVTDLLSALELRQNDRGNSDSLVTKYSVQETVSIIKNDFGALPVLAHIDDKKGAWKELRDHGQTLIKLWEAAEFSAVEIIGDSLPEEIGYEPFHHVPAYYWASDNPHPKDESKHSHLGIGHKFSKFKLDENITWEGLRLCFHDSNVRIKSVDLETRIKPHPLLEYIQIDGGFLTGLDLSLNPNLNCVIGGRGTGKSTLLELIRYAFDLKPKTETNESQAEGLINATFPSGSSITIGFKLEDGTRYRILRYSDRPPKVYRNGEDEEIEIAPANLLPLQVYGQKEIYEISQEPEFQLNLINTYVDEELKPLVINEDEMVRKLRDNSKSILGLKEEVISDLEQLDLLSSYREELRRYDKKKFAERLKQRKDFEKEQFLLNIADERVDETIQDLKSLQASVVIETEEYDEEEIKDLPNSDVLHIHREILGKINEATRKSFSEIIKQVQEYWTDGKRDRESWREKFDLQDNSYQDILKEFQESETEFDPDRYIFLQRKVNDLKKLNRSTKRKFASIDILSKEREVMLDGLREIRREQYELRCRKANELSDLLHGKVRILVHPEGYRNQYKEFLKKLFYGLDVRNPYRDNLAEIKSDEAERAPQKPVKVKGEIQYLVPEIPLFLTPMDLALAIRKEQKLREGEESVLEKTFNVNSEAMRRNISQLTNEKIYELEIYSVPDLPIIGLKVAGGELGYKHLSNLSVGQKCTALLSIVLLESPATLLIDQPEDDLDNEFIFDQIVDTLRYEKERRQFIIVTHNANIPVSGDAELISVLHADEKQGWFPENGIGSIDTNSIKTFVETILEGGEIAFRIRKEKYGIN